MVQRLYVQALVYLLSLLATSAMHMHLKQQEKKKKHCIFVCLIFTFSAVPFVLLLFLVNEQTWVLGCSNPFIRQQQQDFAEVSEARV